MDMTTKPSNLTWKARLRNFFGTLLFVRRIVGDSMLPSLKKNQLVIATGLRKTKKGGVVVAEVNGIEVIKRITDFKHGSVWLEGDNQEASTDSRRYGWIDRGAVRGVVIYPLRKESVKDHTGR